MPGQAKFEESNIALIGTPEDIALRIQAASTEDQWKHAGETDLQIWRIEQFKVVPVPKEHHGTFYNGDSYIVLRTTKVEEQVKYDIHFWIGKSSTQDEYGTAAYKSVELDDFLHHKATLHREVENHESNLFKSYFKHLVYKEGGVASGFHHVGPEQYKPKLYHIKGKHQLVVTESDPDASLMNEGDVYVLDTGLKFFVWKGPQANHIEKFKGNQIALALKDERGKGEIFDTSEDEQAEAEFWKNMKGTKADVKPAQEGGSDEAPAQEFTHVLYRLSDAEGALNLKKVEENVVHKSSLKSDDVFIVDLGETVYVFVGSNASQNEKRSAIHYGQSYLNHCNGEGAHRPIQRVFEHDEPQAMLALLQ